MINYMSVIFQLCKENRVQIKIQMDMDLRCSATGMVVYERV